ncbi:stage III sporulation protein AB [Dendrosporobacter sp. 1207_IL3150]|uniref:stage III sporulation protein AB n=1 Tax=Dendrosporobacter sp. 1207_IL3150 TaxID=3084054 RepID=UPI002FD88BFF
MWLKLLGSIFVIITGTYIGFKLASRCSTRPQHIRQIISCIVSLKSYINYVSMPLPDALVKSTAGTEGPVSVFFRDTAALLEFNGWMNPQQAIKEVLGKMEDKLAIEKPEREILSLLGANLGSMNREEQNKYLNMIQEQLENIEQEAVKTRDQNSKMYKYLGVCGGLAVVILFI